MKSSSLIKLAVLALSLMLHACNGDQEHQVEENTILIEGQIENPRAESLVFQRYFGNVPLKKEVLKEVVLEDDHSFKVSFEWEEPGFIHVTHGDYQTRLFMEPGQDLIMHSTGEDFGDIMEFGGAAGSANVFVIENLSAFRKEAGRILEEEVDQEPTDFLEAINTSYTSFYNDLQKANQERELSEAFFNTFHDYLKYSFGTILFRYGSLLDDVSPEALPPGYYEFTDSVSTAIDKPLNITPYLDYLENYLNYRSEKAATEHFESREQYQLHRFDLAGKHLEGPPQEVMKVREIHLLKENSHEETGEKLLKEIREEVSDDLLRIIEHEEHIPRSGPEEGDQAPAFKYPDPGGNEVALDSFRGDVVYLDIWASWCNPCLQEFPHTKELHKEFKDEDVTFLYVSIDEEEESWRSALEAHDLKGTNLYAGNHFDAQIMEDYGVDAIPRYIIISKAGEIVDINAPRPSRGAEEAIKEALDKRG